MREKSYFMRPVYLSETLI